VGCLAATSPPTSCSASSHLPSSPSHNSTKRSANNRKGAEKKHLASKTPARGQLPLLEEGHGIPCAIFKCNENCAPPEHMPANSPLRTHLSPASPGTAAGPPALSFMSLSDATPFPATRRMHHSHRAAEAERPTHPLNPALSCMNLLESAISLSIASRMCKPHVRPHRVRVQRTATLVLILPSGSLELVTYNHRVASVPPTHTARTARTGTSPVASIGSRSWHIAWYLELVKERRERVHRAVRHEQHPARPRRLRFWLRRPGVSSSSGANKNAHGHGTHRELGRRLLVLISSSCTMCASTRGRCAPPPPLPHAPCPTRQRRAPARVPAAAAAACVSGGGAKGPAAGGAPGR